LFNLRCDRSGIEDKKHANNSFGENQKSEHYMLLCNDIITKPPDVNYCLLHDKKKIFFQIVHQTGISLVAKHDKSWNVCETEIRRNTQKAVLR
jgi:hypothetical protein